MRKESRLSFAWEDQEPTRRVADIDWIWTTPPAFDGLSAAAVGIAVFSGALLAWTTLFHPYLVSPVIHVDALLESLRYQTVGEISLPFRRIADALN